MKDKQLFKNKWIEVKELDDWYTYWSNPQGNRGVIVLGFRRSITEPGRSQFLARIENTPCHDRHGLRFRTSLSGMVDGSLGLLDTAMKELKEESGYSVTVDRLVNLGWVYLTKNSDYELHLFGADLNGLEQGEIIGDGSRGEDGASVEWVRSHDILNMHEAAMTMAMVKLHQLAHVNLSLDLL